LAENHLKIPLIKETYQPMLRESTFPTGQPTSCHSLKVLS
jgi:hypothetical protein